MAVISDIPGLKVEVRVNHQPLEEFVSEDKPDAPEAVTRYVEATSGVNFTVRTTIDSEALEPKYSNCDFSATLSLDGEKVDKCSISRDNWEREGKYSFVFYGARGHENGKHFQRRMAFSQIKIDETDKALSSTAQVEAFRSLGEIKVTLWRCRTDTKPANQTSGIPFRSNFDSIDSVESIPEKKLKGRAISHHVKLGEAIPYTPSGLRFYSDKFDREPFATFIFHYRSRDALKAECIIPRSPTPVPLKDRPAEDLTAEEARELVRRLRDRGGQRPTPHPKLKHEVKEEAEQIMRTGDVNIVDLGSDDSDIEITDVRARKRQRTSGPIEVIDLSND